MVRGRKVGSKRNLKKTSKSRDECSDDSDEDYVVSDGEEESDVAEDALDDLDGSALEDEIELEEEQEEEEEEEEEEEYEDVEEEEEEVKKPVKWKAKPSTSVRRKSGGTKDVRKRKGASSDEDDEDFDIDEDDIIEEEEDDEDDEEFTPEEDEFWDDEDSASKGRNRRKLGSRKKSGRPRSRKKVSTRGRKRRKKSTSSKNPSRKIGKKNSHVRRKPKSDDDADFEEDNEVVTIPRRKNLGQRRRIYVSDSDSDFENFGQSDYKYTVSDEEREQMQEASEFCRALMPATRTSSSKRIKNGANLSFRGSTCSKRTVKDGDLSQQRKYLGQKGKEKVEEVKVAKQVCGICLSEEDKRRVRGTLDCCCHYFCFTCIMQWSKVESRCPLCKQRFKTLSKPAR